MPIPRINDYINGDKSAHDYIADLQAAGMPVSDEQAARFVATFARARAKGPSFTPRPEPAPKEEGFALGFDPKLPEPLVRHTNKPDYQSAVNWITGEIGAALGQLPGGAAVRSQYIEDTGAIRYTFDVGNRQVSTEVQPSRYPERWGNRTIDWGQVVATPTSVREKLGDRWEEVNYLTAGQGIAQVLAKAAGASTPEEAERIIEVGQRGFGNLARYANVTENKSLRARKGAATRVQWLADYEPSAWDLYQRGGLPEGHFLRGRPQQIEPGSFTHMAYDWRVAAPGLVEDLGGGRWSFAAKGEKAANRAQLGEHETSYRSFRFDRQQTLAERITGVHSGEVGQTAQAFFAQTEVAGPGMDLIRSSQVQGRIRYSQRSFLAQGNVEWVEPGTRGEPGQPLILGYDVVGEERRPITFKPPRGAIATFATSGRFNPDDERSWRYEVESELPAYSGQFKWASQGVKALHGIGREEDFAAWSPLYQMQNGILRRRGDQPFDILSSQEQVKVPRSTMVSVADYLAAKNPALHAALQLPASGPLREEDYARMEDYIGGRMAGTLSALRFAPEVADPRGMRLLYRNVHEKELNNYLAAANTQRALNLAEELGIPNGPQRIISHGKETPFYRVPILEPGVNLGVLHQLQEQYPTKRNVLSMEQLAKIGGADWQKYGPMVRNWIKHGGTPERALALSADRNRTNAAVHTLDPASLVTMVGEGANLASPTSGMKLANWEKTLKALGYDTGQPFGVNLEDILGPQAGWQGAYDQAAKALGATLPRTANYALPSPRVMRALAQGRESGQETSRLVSYYMKAIEGLGRSDVTGLAPEAAQEHTRDVLTNLIGYQAELGRYLSGAQVGRKTYGAKIPNLVGAPAVTYSGLAPNTVAFGQEAMEQLWDTTPDVWWRREQGERLMAKGTAGILMRREPSVNRANIVARGITEEEMTSLAAPGTIIPVNLGWNMAVPESMQTVMGGDYDSDLVYGIPTGRARWKNGRWNFGATQPLRAMTEDEVLNQGVELMRRSNPYVMDQLAGLPAAEQLAQGGVWHSEYFKYFNGLLNPKPLGWSAAANTYTTGEVSNFFMKEYQAKQAMGYGYWGTRANPLMEMLAQKIPEGPFRKEILGALDAFNLSSYQPGLDRMLRNTGLLSVFYGTTRTGQVLDRFAPPQGNFPQSFSTGGRSRSLDPTQLQGYIVDQLAKGVVNFSSPENLPRDALNKGAGEIMPASAAALLTLNEDKYRQVTEIFERLRRGDTDVLNARTNVNRVLGLTHYADELAGPLLASAMGSSMVKTGMPNIPPQLTRVADVGQRLSTAMSSHRAMPFEERLKLLAGIPQIGPLGEILQQTLAPFDIPQRTTMHNGDTVKALFTPHIKGIEDVLFGVGPGEMRVTLLDKETVITPIEAGWIHEAIVGGKEPRPELLSWLTDLEHKGGIKPSNDTAPQPTGVPMFMSKGLQQQLYDLGYPKDAVNTMSPADAQSIITAQRTYQSSTQTSSMPTQTVTMKEHGSGAITPAVTVSSPESTQSYPSQPYSVVDPAGWSEETRRNATHLDPQPGQYPQFSPGSSSPARNAVHRVKDKTDEELQRLVGLGFTMAKQSPNGTFLIKPSTSVNQGLLNLELGGFLQNDMERTPEQLGNLRRQLGSAFKPLEFIRRGLLPGVTDAASMVDMLRGVEGMYGKVDQLGYETLFGGEKLGPGVMGKIREKIAASLPGIGEVEAWMATARNNPALAQRQAVYAGLFKRWNKTAPTPAQKEAAIAELAASGQSGAGAMVEHVADMIRGAYGPELNQQTAKQVWAAKRAAVAGGAPVPLEMAGILDARLNAQGFKANQTAELEARQAVNAFNAPQLEELFAPMDAAGRTQRILRRGERYGPKTARAFERVGQAFQPLEDLKAADLYSAAGAASELYQSGAISARTYVDLRNSITSVSKAFAENEQQVKAHTEAVKKQKEAEEREPLEAYNRRIGGLTTRDRQNLDQARATLMAPGADYTNRNVLQAAGRFAQREFAAGDPEAFGRATDILAQNDMIGQRRMRGGLRGAAAFGGNVFDELSLGGTAFRMRMTMGLLTGNQNRWMNEFFQSQAPIQEAALMLGAVPGTSANASWLTAQAQLANARVGLGRGVAQVMTPMAAMLGGVKGGSGAGALAALLGIPTAAGMGTGYIMNAIAGMLPEAGTAAAGITAALPLVVGGIGLGALGFMGTNYVSSEAKSWYQYDEGSYSRLWRQASERWQEMVPGTGGKILGTMASTGAGIANFFGQMTPSGRQVMSWYDNHLGVSPQMAVEAASWRPGNLGFDINQLETFSANRWNGITAGQGPAILGQIGQIGGLNAQQVQNNPTALAIADLWAQYAQAGVNPSDISQSALKTMGQAGIPLGPQGLQWIANWNQLPRQQQLINEQAMGIGEQFFASRGYGPEQINPRAGLIGRSPAFAEVGAPEYPELDWIKDITTKTGSEIKAKQLLVNAESVAIQIGGNARQIIEANQQKYNIFGMAPDLAGRTMNLATGLGGVASSFGLTYGSAAAARFEQGFIDYTPAFTEALRGIGSQIAPTMLRFGESPDQMKITARYLQRQGLNTQQIQTYLASTYGTLSSKWLSDTTTGKDLTETFQALATKYGISKNSGDIVEGMVNQLFNEPLQHVTGTQANKLLQSGGAWEKLLSQYLDNQITSDQLKEGALMQLGYGADIVRLGGFVPGTLQGSNFEKQLNPVMKEGYNIYGGQLASFMGQYGAAPDASQLNMFSTGFGYNTAWTQNAFQIASGQQGYAWRQMAKNNYRMNAFGGQGWQYGGMEYSPTAGLQTLGYAEAFQRQENYGRLSHTYAVAGAQGQLDMHRAQVDMTLALRENTKAMTDENRRYAVEQAGFAMQRAGLSYRQGMESVELSQREAQTRARQQREEFAISGQRMAVTQGWQREDLTYQANMAGLQFGWQQEDYQRNIRFATGRQRQDLIRQMQRAQVTYGMQTTQMGRERERTDTKQTWEQEDLARQKRNFEELQTLQNESFQLQRKHLRENYALQMQQIAAELAHEQKMWGLEDERRDLENKYQDKQMKFEDEQLKRSLALAKLAAENFEADIQRQKELDAAAKAYYDEQTKAYQEGGNPYDAFRTFIEKIQIWLDSITPPGGNGRPTSPKEGDEWTGDNGTEIYHNGKWEPKPGTPKFGGKAVGVNLSEPAFMANLSHVTGPNSAAMMQVRIYLGAEDVTDLITTRVTTSSKFERAIDNLARRQRNTFIM